MFEEINRKRGIEFFLYNALFILFIYEKCVCETQFLFKKIEIILIFYK